MRVLIGLLVLSFMLPKVGIKCVIAVCRQKKIHIFSSEYVGLGMKEIQHRAVMIDDCPLSDFYSWFHYIKGHLDFIGPEKLSMKRALLLTAAQRRRFDVAPGIISPYKIKHASGIAHKTELDVASDFVAGASRSRRFQLALIWAVQSIVSFRRQKAATSPTFNLFGVTLNNVTAEDFAFRVIL